MNRFIEMCCEECHHSDKNPCEHFIQCSTEGALCHHTAECSEKIKDLNQRLIFKKHDKPLIFIGMGTCGLASGANKVKLEIEKYLAASNIEADIIPTGCIGYCAEEPIVEVKLPGKP